MSIPGLRVEESPSLFAGPGRSRKMIAVIAAAFVMGCSFYVGVISSIHECHLVFYDAPRTALSAALVSQVAIVKKIVPRGSFIIYFMDKPETWRFGLWKRSFFPDYTVLPVVGLKELDSPVVRTFRARHQVRYIILANSIVPPVTRQIVLPPNPEGTKMILAELEN
jgi:hypothetical protein